MPGTRTPHPKIKNHKQISKSTMKCVHIYKHVCIFIIYLGLKWMNMKPKNRISFPGKISKSFSKLRSIIKHSFLCVCQKCFCLPRHSIN